LFPSFYPKKGGSKIGEPTPKQKRKSSTKEREKKLHFFSFSFYTEDVEHIQKTPHVRLASFFSQKKKPLLALGKKVCFQAVVAFF
jgi:hypothetical protein